MSKLQSQKQNGTEPQNNSQQHLNHSEKQQLKKKGFRMRGLKFPSLKYIFTNPEDTNLESEARITEPAKQPQRREAIYPNVTKSVGTTPSTGNVESNTKKKKTVLNTIKDKSKTIRSRASKTLKHKSDEFDYSDQRTQNNNNNNNNKSTKPPGGNVPVLEEPVTTPSKSNSNTKTTAAPPVRARKKVSKQIVANLPAYSSSSESISSSTSSPSECSTCSSSRSSCSSPQSSPSIKKKLPQPPTKPRKQTSSNQSEKQVEREEFEEQKKKPLPAPPRRKVSKTEVPQTDPAAPVPPGRGKSVRPNIPSFGPSEKVEKSIQVKAPSRETSGFTTITITTTTTKQIPIPSISASSFGNDPRFSNAVGFRSTSTPSGFGKLPSRETSGRSESSEYDNNMILARALFDFSGETLDDLTFWKGDIITILFVSEDGWWIGLVDDNVGKLPSNFVEVLPSHYFLARANSDYRSQAKDELSFEENDLILVTKSKGEWLYGEVAGCQGWFPYKCADQVCLTPSE